MAGWIKATLAVGAIAGVLTGPPLHSANATEIEVLRLPPGALAQGVRVYLSKRITASPASENRPPPIEIGAAPETFHCALNDVVILQSGHQPNRRDGSRSCSVYLEDDIWKLRVRNVKANFTESMNSRVECQAICMATELGD